MHLSRVIQFKVIRQETYHLITAEELLSCSFKTLSITRKTGQMKIPLNGYCAQVAHATHHCVSVSQDSISRINKQRHAITLVLFTSQKVVFPFSTLPFFQNDHFQTKASLVLL